MKKKLAISLLLLLIGFVPLTIIRPASASIDDISWVAPRWRGVYDDFLGYVDVAYISGSTWTLNVYVSDFEYNATFDQMDAKVTNIAVWFDWNKFYNTTENVVIKFGTSYLFTITGTTESTTLASNLFTHNWKVYVDFEISFMSGGASTTQKKTWGPWNGDDFAVLSQAQYDAWLAEGNYWNFYNEVYYLLDNYADSNELFIRAQAEANKGMMQYGQGDFSDALTSLNGAWDMLNQSFAIYTTHEMDYDTIYQGMTQADLDKQLAEINAINANATATQNIGDAAKIVANGQSQAMMINAVGFVFFGLGFIIFGIGAVFWARKPKAT